VHADPARRGTRAFDRIKMIPDFGAADMPKRIGTGNIIREFERSVRQHDPALALACDLVGLNTDDSAAATHIVAGANGLLCSTYGDTREARASLRCWDDVARGKHSGSDFFEIADKHWRDEMQQIVADSPRGALMRDRYSHPALQALIQPRWDWSFGSLQPPTRDILGDESMARLIDAVNRVQPGTR
jgi:hypothetical protein